MNELLSVDYKIPEHLSAFGPIIDGIVIADDPRNFVHENNNINGVNANSNSNNNNNNNNLSDNSPPSYIPVSSYDVLFGITRFESPPVFTSYEERHGIDVLRRDKILRTLVRNLFDYHQQVIFLTLINEYTDWSKSIDHPINLLDSLAEILGDALVVAPIIQSGDINVRATLSSLPTSSSSSSSPSNSFSSSHLNYRRHHHTSGGSNTPVSNIKSPYSAAQSFTPGSNVSPSSTSNTGINSLDTRTFFYVFAYNNGDLMSSSSSSSSSSFSNSYSMTSSNGNVSPSNRLGCQHGDELNYIFGAPLAQDHLGYTLGHFHGNFTRAEYALSEAVMTYWINFVKFG